MSNQTKLLTTLAMLAAVSYISVVFIRIPIMPAAPFLDYDPKDVVIVIGGFMFGPLAALFLSIVTALLQFFTLGASTGLLGLFMNIIASASFTCTAAFIYSYKKSVSGAVIGLVSGILMTTGVMLLWNYIITPIWLEVPRAAVAAMLVPVFLPFNLIKSGLNAAIAMFLYKQLSSALKKIRLAPTSDIKQNSEVNTLKRNIGVMLVSAFAVLTLILVILAIQQPD